MTRRTAKILDIPAERLERGQLFGHGGHAMTSRDPDAPDFGVWKLVKPTGKVVVRGTLADVQRHLTTR
jgi:hypothetical protein